jgi:hypothetical protein
MDVYLSEYKTECWFTENYFCETIHQTEQSYVSEYKVVAIDNTKKKMYLMNESSNQYNPGKYSSVKYLKGSMKIKCKTVYYFAFYFETYDKPDLLSVKDTDKIDASKYTWCVRHKIGSNDANETVEKLCELAKKIKTKYIKKNNIK